MVHITSLYAGLVVLLGLILTWLVISVRLKDKVSLGDGEQRELTNRIRAHGNLIETAPLFLITLLLIETNGASPVWLHGLGATFLIARLSHAVGMLRLFPKIQFRSVGMVLTLISMTVAALFLLIQVVVA